MRSAEPVIDISGLRSQATNLAKEFADARPIRHVVVDDVLTVATDAASTFPTREWDQWHYEGDAYQVNKFTSRDMDVIPEPWHKALRDLTSPQFLETLETITGIDKLIADPYFEGGGLHLSTEGGILGPHTDFHIYARLDLYRRVNVIVYLNPNWESGDGGELVISNSKHPEYGNLAVEPIWGRMVIFQTDDISVHGFTNPIGKQRSRRSLATYYYTALDTSEFSGDSTTHWRSHGTFRGGKRLQLAFSRSMMQISRGFSLIAHLSNPNQGLSWWQSRKRRTRREN